MFWDLIEVLTVQLIYNIVVVIDIFDSSYRWFLLRSQQRLRGRKVECGRCLTLGKEELFTFWFNYIFNLFFQYGVFVDVVWLNVLL